MAKDDIIKTVFDFYIVDFIIFGILAGILAVIICGSIWFLLGEIGKTVYPLVFFLLLILLMYWNYKFRYKKKLKKTKVMEILKTRFAKGDITKEQYDEMKKKIEQ